MSFLNLSINKSISFLACCSVNSYLSSTSPNNSSFVLSVCNCSQINAPVEWIGKSFQILNVRQVYHINVIGVKDNEDKMSLNIGANYTVKKGDRFFVIGKTDDLEKFDYYTK